MNLALVIATCGGLGNSPWFPGTVGSLGAFVTYGALFLQLPFIFNLVFIVCLYGAGTWAAGVVSTHLKINDPRCVVIDEWVAVFLLCATLPISWKAQLLGLVFFRIFDISKPWPISQLEKLPGAHGIMADDIAAAAFSFCATQGFYTAFGLS